MDFLRQTWDRWTEFAGKLSGTQKISIGVLGVLIVTAFSLLSMSGGSVAMQPLFYEDTPPEVGQEAMKHLDTRGIPYEVRVGGRIYVPRENADKLRMELLGEGVLPEGPDLYKWIFEPDFTATEQKRGLEWQVTVQRRLERMIASMDPIQSAQVGITWAKDNDFVFESQREKPKASVRVKMKSGRMMAPENVMAIAGLVAGLVKNLERQDVWIVDSAGKAYEIPAEDSLVAIAADQLQIKQRHEEALEKKAREALIPLLGSNVVVKASVTLDSKSRSETLTGKDPRATFEERIVTESERSKGGESSAAPGVQSNLPTAPEPAGESTTEESRDRKEVMITSGERQITELTPPGTILDQSLMVVAGFEEILRDPRISREKLGKLTETERVQVYQSRVKELTESLARATKCDPAKIAFAAFAAAEPEAVPAALTWPQETMLFVKEHGDQVALAFIATLGMFFLYRMVKTAVPKDVLNEIARLREEVAEEEKVVEAAAPMAEVHVQAVQLRDKVREMVKKNPRTAANLLRRWSKE